MPRCELGIVHDPTWRLQDRFHTGRKVIRGDRIPATRNWRPRSASWPRRCMMPAWTLILLEMMYVPRRIEIALEAAISTGLPVWLGLSARRAEDGQLLSFVSGQDLPFEEIARFATTPGVTAAGVMHTPCDQVSEALAKIRVCFRGPTYAYPESGYFEMPNWVFHDTVSPDAFAQYAGKWIEEGAGAVGGCCGLSQAHIEAIAGLA